MPHPFAVWLSSITRAPAFCMKDSAVSSGMPMDRPQAMTAPLWNIGLLPSSIKWSPHRPAQGISDGSLKYRKTRDYMPLRLPAVGRDSGVSLVGSCSAPASPSFIFFSSASVSVDWIIRFPFPVLYPGEFRESVHLFECRLCRFF